MKQNIDDFNLAQVCSQCHRVKGKHHVVGGWCPQLEDGKFSTVYQFNPVWGHGVINKPGLPTDAAARKNIPVYTGFVKYFPRGMAAVAELSRIANEQHNPGQPIHWDKSKSQDEKDALMRHMLDEALGVPVDTDKVLHATKRAWRAMADLERTLEKQHADRAPLSVSGT